MEKINHDRLIESINQNEKEQLNKLQLTGDSQKIKEIKEMANLKRVALSLGVLEVWSA